LENHIFHEIGARQITRHRDHRRIPARKKRARRMNDQRSKARETAHRGGLRREKAGAYTAFSLRTKNQPFLRQIESASENHSVAVAKLHRCRCRIATARVSRIASHDATLLSLNQG
jgi:hypothetical protein